MALDSPMAVPLSQNLPLFDLPKVSVGQSARRKSNSSHSSPQQEQVQSSSPSPTAASSVKGHEGPADKFAHAKRKCEYCSYSGTSEELQVHLKSCNAFIKCPLGCDSPIMRLLLEPHKVNCSHRVVSCKYLGCTAEFMKKDELEHDNNFIAQHTDCLLSLTDSQYRELKARLQHVEEELEKEKKKNAVQQEKINHLTKMIEDLKMELSKFKPNHAFQQAGLSFSFCMECSRLKESSWRSPSMATTEGYKFLFEVKPSDAAGRAVSLYAVRGEQDDQLKWPTSACFTLSLINYKGGDNKKVSEYVSWERPAENLHFLQNFPSDSPSPFIIHSKLPFYLSRDQLHFELFVVMED